MSDATRNFKMIPDQEELDQMERDLSFYPSKVTSPKILSKEQVEHFNREGYVRPIPIFDDAEINEIRSYFDELLNRVIAEGGDSYSISSAHLKYGQVYDLLKHPKIVACVTDILGENIVGWGSHFFCKMPHDGKSVAWHQDASYWPLSPSKALTVWLAIDDADIENACMKFVSGSHHVGHLTYRPSDSGEHNVLNQTVEDPEQYGAVVYDELKAGQISLHSDLLLHGSEANNSDRRRCGLTLRYAACDVHAAMNWNEKGVLVNGQDASGHWANRERPQND
ncbi:phytanoyl-CoA dioxygenase family protein [Thalassoglobus sp.]|uniref:phytanoyl-CoA dioxygenase family protein n=1 Tax=Thalassoglobus sp. TaxID=2795869 RepID=UPI003AA7ABF0